MAKGVIAFLLLLLLMGAGVQLIDAHVMLEKDIFSFEEFLSIDQTDKNIGIKDSYECLNFSLDLIKNASAMGYNVVLVIIPPRGGSNISHAVIGFMLEDGSIALFEPSTDDQISLWGLRAEGIHEIKIIQPETVKRIDVEHIWSPPDTIAEVMI